MSRWDSQQGRGPTGTLCHGLRPGGEFHRGAMPGGESHRDCAPGGMSHRCHGPVGTPTGVLRTAEVPPRPRGPVGGLHRGPRGIPTGSPHPVGCPTGACGPMGGPTGTAHPVGSPTSAHWGPPPGGAPSLLSPPNKKKRTEKGKKTHNNGETRWGAEEKPGGMSTPTQSPIKGDQLQGRREELHTKSRAFRNRPGLLCCNLKCSILFTTGKTIYQEGNLFIKLASSLSSEAEIQKITTLQGGHVAKEIRQHKVNKTKCEEQVQRTRAAEAPSTCKSNSSPRNLRGKGAKLQQHEHPPKGT
ncbi:hypothetical protein Taro_039405 [Colocasia esculenta]|uniref:Uncharacterized protein n=1 Tax=Colocasia esculenta TaxID=4460 RepID=A0A843WIS9_COLES|nr:hypothetical protein [Colocasia esculenta]